MFSGGIEWDKWFEMGWADAVGILWSCRSEVFCKKGVLKNFAKFTGKHLCQSLFFNKFLGFMKEETLVQEFSCEFCEISENSFSYRTPLVTTSVFCKLQIYVLLK